jgi:hypothetical protein
MVTIMKLSYYGSHDGINWLECLTSSMAESYRHWRVESHPDPVINWEKRCITAEARVEQLESRMARAIRNLNGGA